MARDKASIKKLLLIDGNSLFHRAYHALPPITDKSGEVANAVFGFSNMLLKAIDETKPAYIACAFDTKAPTFRHVEFEQYKAQRVEPPPDLYPQLPKIKCVLDAFGIKYFEKEGYEADDLIATLSEKALSQKQKAKGLKPDTNAFSVKRSALSIIILSGDRDTFQLVDGNVKVQMPGWNLKETTLYGAREVKKKYGLTPAQMVDFKSLMGDASDNVPGISGIGLKTASTLLQKYKTLENLYRHVKETPLKVQEKLEAGKEDALAAKKLVELDRDVDISFKLPELRFQPNWDQVRNEYQELGFKSIVAKLPGDKEEDSEVTNGSKESKDLRTKKSQDQLELV